MKCGIVSLMMDSHTQKKVHVLTLGTHEFDCFFFFFFEKKDLLRMLKCDYPKLHWWAFNLRQVSLQETEEKTQTQKKGSCEDRNRYSNFVVSNQGIPRTTGSGERQSRSSSTAFVRRADLPKPGFSTSCP